MLVFVNLVNPEKVFESASKVDEAVVSLTHTPLTEKQPEVRLIPFAKVEEAVAEVTLSKFV